MAEFGRAVVCGNNKQTNRSGELVCTSLDVRVKELVKAIQDYIKNWNKNR
jgi:hypothetical protein